MEKVRIRTLFANSRKHVTNFGQFMAGPGHLRLWVGPYITAAARHTVCATLSPNAVMDTNAPRTTIVAAVVLKLVFVDLLGFQPIIFCIF